MHTSGLKRMQYCTNDWATINRVRFRTWLANAENRFKFVLRCFEKLSAGRFSIPLPQKKQALAAATGRVISNTYVIFQVSAHYLPQRLQCVDGIYTPVLWSNILHPSLQVTLSVPCAMKAISAQAIAPETCLN